jgi:hypothetical protein
MLKATIAGTVLSISALYGLTGLTGVDAGEYAVKVKQFGDDKGMQPDGLSAGTHWVDPLMYDVFVYDTRFKQYTIEGMRSTTKDGQPIALDVSFEIGLALAVIPELHSTVGKEYFEQVVLPAARAAIRKSTSGANSDVIYTGEGRKQVEDQIDSELSSLLDRGVKLTTNLRNVSFTDKDFVAKLEEKAQAAQQVIIEERRAEAADA